MSKVIPVVFCFDKRILLGASVAIKSLIDCAKEDTTYDIRIFHSDLDIKNQKNITLLAENTRHSIAFHYINPEIFKGAPHNKKSWTELVYYRLLVPEVLREYDKVIYSDVDVLFKGDLSELYNTNIDDYEFGAVRAEKNSPDAIGHQYFEQNKKDYIFWSGLLLINCQRFREEDLLPKLLSNAGKYSSKLKFFDLDLLNITCEKMYALPLKYCVLQSLFYLPDYKSAKEYSYLNKVYSDEEIQNSIKNVIIVHYAGKMGKPWRMKNPYPDYSEYINKLPKELRQYTFRDIRKKLFNRR